MKNCKQIAAYYLQVDTWMDQNWTKQNGIFQLSVAYMGPLATLSSHLEGLTPLRPVAKRQIYYTKS